VVPDPARRCEVKAGEVTVRALGTRFRVERLEDGRTRVDVTRGHVEVVWANGRAALFAGQDGAFPREVKRPKTAMGEVALGVGLAPIPEPLETTSAYR
jgi:ferric-dicitrate binding protein FerR (iron transport regulator)